MEDESQEDQGLKAVPASEILAKIEKGEQVEYDHVMIKGDLNVSMLNLPKDGDRILVGSSIEITNSEIFGRVDFSNTILREIVDFRKTKFIMNASFCGTQFNDDSYFLETVFCLSASFDKSRFNKAASFLEAKFNLGSSFIGTLFETNAWFLRAQFRLDSDFKDARFYGEANFMETLFTMKTNFGGTKFVESVGFSGAQFGLHTCFEGAQFCRKSYFNIVRVFGDIDFSRAQFGEDACFDGSEIKKDVIFTRAEFGGKVDFVEARISGDANFRDASFIADVHFIRTLFEGDVLTFRDAEFRIPQFQEDACRRAKNLLEKKGDREEAGYHFYREMDAKRKQKPWYIRYPEFFFLQLIFGYGVHPPRLIAWWGIIVAAFAAFYWIGSGLNGAIQLFDYLKFSLATAIAPGYIATIISPGSTGYMLAPKYQAVAIVESLFGTFLWAGFIATFAKKYMR